MAPFFLYLLIVLCLGLILRVIISPKLIFEYPYFIGGMFLIFLVPQAIILYNNYFRIPKGALESTLLMSFLCLLMVVLGYFFAPLIPFAKKLDVELDDKRLRQVGLFFTAVGYAFNILIWKYYASYEDAGLEVSTQPSGIITIYFLFYSIINLAFPIFFYLAISKPNVFNIVMTVVAAFPTLYAIIVSGRREPTALFVLLIAFILYRKKAIVPPRFAIVGMILFAMFFIPATSDYRTMSDKLGPAKAIQSLDLKKSFVNHYTEGFGFLELNVAAHIVDSYSFTGNYEYGAGYWNLLVFRYVPAQFLGKEFKQSLMLGKNKSNIEFRNGYMQPKGITPTGIGDSFMQLGFLGCMFFFFQGGFFRSLWRSVEASENVLLHIFYIVCVVQAMLSVTHGTTIFVPGILFYFICLLAGAAYAKVKN